MFQVKTIQFKSIDKMDDAVNSFLSTLPDDAFKGIIVNEDKGFAVIQYIAVEAYTKALCCDCKHWDDSNDSGSTVGLCQESGTRKRFNCKACPRFSDVRG